MSQFNEWGIYHEIKLILSVNENGWLYVFPTLFFWILCFLIFTGKPHRFLSTSFCIVDIEQETVNVNFEVISNPSPFEFRLWDVKENERSREKVQSSVINVTCKSDTKRPYLSRCTLTVFNSSFQETSGLQKIQLKNEIGYENFTVKICHGKRMLE